MNPYNQEKTNQNPGQNLGKGQKEGTTNPSRGATGQRSSTSTTHTQGQGHKQGSNPHTSTSGQNQGKSNLHTGRSATPGTKDQKSPQDDRFDQGDNGQRTGHQTRKF